MKALYQTIVISLLFLACEAPKETAQSIVDKSIERHGGDLYENSIVDFDFRGRHYTFERDQGMYTYHRIWSDSAGLYHDILTNNGFSRTLNDEPVKVSEDWARRYSNSINSVAYFSYLPFGLNDPAVRKTLLEPETIGGEPYHRVQVTFIQEGGGEDYEDVFVYWIHQKTYEMKYFGYSYISDGGGIRFRESINMRSAGGLTYSDYINYKGPDDCRDVGGLGQLFETGKLDKLSEIKLENLEAKMNK